MVDVTTLEAIAAQLPANDTAPEPLNPELWKEAPRRERILLLREVIERGDYRISASQLADAILRTIRRAN
ncbi:MAG TPA: flagellar biosynthesis anti-sigma factor FlgM [Acidobacteriaceae bacterium]|nr:flagellar biosynthesis anti-sigma factor FlgM [Acidobacteriaceae bacterium]